MAMCLVSAKPCRAPPPRQQTSVEAEPAKVQPTNSVRRACLPPLTVMIAAAIKMKRSGKRDEDEDKVAPQIR